MTAPSSLARSEPATELARKILDYFASRPSLQEVALRVMADSLPTRYHWLPINHTGPMLLTPVYRYDNGGFVLEGHDAQNLPDALIERCASGHYVDFNQGQLIAQNAQGVSLPQKVEMRDIEKLLNQQGPLLLERYQEALVDYWMSPGDDQTTRYLWLAETLRNALLDAATTASLAGQQLDMVISLVSRSLATSRFHPIDGQAYIIDQWGERGATNLEMLRGLVLVKQHGQSTTVLLFTLSRGIQRFDSLAQLGDWLVNLLSEIAPGHSMQWRLYQPAGNIFHSFSLTFLAKQLADIKAVLPLVRSIPKSQDVLERAVEVITLDFDSAPIGSTLMQRLRDALPGWLLQAPVDLQWQMSRYAIDLAKQIRQPGWRPFDEGVPSLLDYARQALSAQLAKDFPDRPVIDPDRVKVMIELDERDLHAQPGLLWQLPPLYTHGSWTLSEFSWLALTALDPSRVTLTTAPGHPAVWLTPSDAISLVGRADIRGGYGRLIRAKFKDNPSELLWRKARFIEQLRLQIPMLALEYHLKYPRAFSRKAYVSVAAIFQPRTAETESVVLRPLAFTPSVGEAPDEVRNMFIIGPRSLGEGPQVLYRPMCDVKFIEFATGDALLAAVASPGPLQFQVLAWLPESARSRYLIADLTAPSLAAFERVDFNQSLWSGEGVTLADRQVKGDYLEALFESSVETVLSVTEQPTSSELDAFWGWVKWLFGVGLLLLLTFYGGPAGRALGWLFLAWSVVQDLSAIGDKDSEDKASSVADLLLNIGLLLLSRGRVSTKVAGRSKADDLLDLAQGADLEQSIEMSWSEAPEYLSEGGQTSRMETPTVQLPTVRGPQELVRGEPDLEQLWSGLYRRLSVIRLAELALYKVRPLPFAERISTGKQRGLFRAGGSLYASIDGDMFKVEEHDGVTRVVNDDLVNRLGPQVVPSTEGEWSFSPEPAIPHDFQDALDQEKHRLAQLKSDEQRRKTLDEEYDKLVLQFADQNFPDTTTLQALNARSAESGTRELIEEELARADTTLWCSTALMEALTRRRRLKVVREFSALYNRFSAGAVKARRNRAVLLAGKRAVLLHEDQLGAETFDAQNLSAVVLDAKTWRGFAARLPGYATLQLDAIEACQDAERQFEEMKRTGKALDIAVSALDSADWAGRRMSMMWRELHLRTLALQCFDGRVTVVRDATLNLIQEVSTLCSMKLLSYRELYIKGGFNLDHQLRVANDVLDALVLAYHRLAYQLSPFPMYVVPQALGRFRAFVKELQRSVEEELIELYRQYEEANLEAISGTVRNSPGMLIDEVTQGPLIGSRRSPAVPDAKQEYLDLLEPFDERRAFTFKRLGTEEAPVWTMQPSVRPQAEAVDVVESLETIGGEAQRLWRDARRQYGLICELESVPRMSPRLARGEWINAIKRMSQQRDLLIDALKVPPVSPRHQDLLAFFKHTPAELYDEIIQFMAQASVMRDRMILRYSPTSEGLLQLSHKAKKVDMQELPSVRPLIREFAVRESSTGRPLWLARFHYRTQAARIIGYHFIRGHLKRYEQRHIGYQKMKDHASNRELLINVLRSNIDHEVAETVFFSEDVSSTVR
ncbi:hypothetical protein AO066_07935 [Pseudomonas fluorescens]|nr:hypothetical protein AO066_07935 [Pseudomonas fluorescens]RMP71442.1 hypothetical protein ALQ17_03750 [Pseudomonas fluorescens]